MNIIPLKTTNFHNLFAIITNTNMATMRTSDAVAIPQGQSLKLREFNDPSKMRHISNIWKTTAKKIKIPFMKKLRTG
jgi:hypothetical protein